MVYRFPFESVLPEYRLVHNGACMFKMRAKAKYRVDVKLSDGRRISKSFEGKYDADKFKTEMKLEKICFDSSGLTFNNLITFKDFSDDWFQTEVKNRKSLQTQRNYSTDF